MKCSDCLYYKEGPNEAMDTCTHKQAETTIGGIRTDTVTSYKLCSSMMIHSCENHKLFEGLL